MRYVCFDLGGKRTGVAAGDDVTSIVTPLEVIEIPRSPGHDRLLQALLVIVNTHKPDAIVFGLPLNMDGTEGTQAKNSRQFGEAFGKRCNLPVHFQDERLTSYAADQAMARTGRTRKQKKELRDALAAAEILRDFLDTQRASGAGQ
jgi:putative Holliday junction resolvase